MLNVNELLSKNREKNTFFNSIQFFFLMVQLSVTPVHSHELQLLENTLAVNRGTFNPG